MSKKLYIYEVRGIQDYIFRTNKIKEMVGASKKIENIIIQLFINESGNKKVRVNEQAMVFVKGELPKNVQRVKDDENLDILQENTDTDAEVVYYGGGNLLVLYKNEEIAESISRKMSMQLIKETYSLRIVYAGVDVTGDYHADYAKLREVLADKKAVMPATELVRGFPITMNDPVTGMPFSMKKDGNMITYEAYKKLESYRGRTENSDINTFGSEEGESLIAIVHIDGNRMGDFVKGQMQAKETSHMSYDDAAKKTRKISRIIQKSFVTDALGKVEENIERYCECAGLKEKKKDHAFRKIITAGDDITFICNARIAMNCVREFMKALDENEYEFTACGGIYVTHTHFPFSRAYEYAEELCDSAKKLSRSNPGNYIDFLVGYGGILNSLDVIKDKEFKDVEGNKMGARPYFVTEPEKYDADIYGIDELVLVLNKIKNIPRTKLKGLRESFISGTQLFEQELDRINSRLKKEDWINLDRRKYGILFDAIDIMDLKWGEYSDETKKTGEEE